MWKITTTLNILLVVLLINFSSAAVQRWYKNKGFATLACPLDDDPNDPTLLPYQGDCSKFMKCSYGLAYVLDCPRGLHFSKTLWRCEAPSEAACDPNESTPKPSIGGAGCSFTYRPHPTDCNKAIQCVDGAELTIECPVGAQWDKAYSKCSFEAGVC